MNVEAAEVFAELAAITGGRSAPLGADFQLGELCEAVALITSDGAKAAKRIGNKRVRQLLLEHHKAD